MSISEDPTIWDHMTYEEKVEFNSNMNMKAPLPKVIVPKEKSDKITCGITQSPDGNHLELTSKEVTEKVNLPYTVVSDEISSEHLNIKDEVVNAVAANIAKNIDEELVGDWGVMSNSMGAVSDSGMSIGVAMKLMMQNMGSEIHLMKDGVQHTTLKVPNLEFTEDNHVLNFQIKQPQNQLDPYDEIKVNDNIYMVTSQSVSMGGIDDDVYQDVTAKHIGPYASPVEGNIKMYDKEKKGVFGIDPAKGKDKSAMWVKNEQGQHFDIPAESQTKTIYPLSKDPFQKKDPMMLKYYVLPINYELLKEFPQLYDKYKVGSFHKIEDMAFEVVDHDKDIQNQQIKITMKEAENIGITGPNDSLMDGIKGHDTMKDLFGTSGPEAVLMDEKVSIDELTITPPSNTGKSESVPITERDKMFKDLTTGVSAS